MKPALLAFLAAVLWGLWWIPIHYLEALGLNGAMGGVAMNAGAGLASLVWLALAPGTVRLSGRAALGAMLVGVAVSTFSTALNYSDVVRVILLFYLAPAWSKIIEWAFLGMPWRWTSSVALAAALGGAGLILGGQISGGGVQPGDVLAVLAGVAWAGGAALVFTCGRSGAVPLTVVSALSAVLVGALYVWIADVGPIGPDMAKPAAMGLGLGVIYVLPILFLTLWSAQRLAPATLTFLLTAEILSGVGSGVLILNEPFGALQAAGAALIVFGALSEVLPSLRLSGATRG